MACVPDAVRATNHCGETSAALRGGHPRECKVRTLDRSEAMLDLRSRNVRVRASAGLRSRGLASDTRRQRLTPLAVEYSRDVLSGVVPYTHEARVIGVETDHQAIARKAPERIGSPLPQPPRAPIVGCRVATGPRVDVWGNGREHILQQPGNVPSEIARRVHVLFKRLRAWEFQGHRFDVIGFGVDQRRQVFV